MRERMGTWYIPSGSGHKYKTRHAYITVCVFVRMLLENYHYKFIDPLNFMIQL